jgi:glycerol-3-phosphate dehydrogenase
MHLDDVLARRTRVAIEVRDRGLAAAEEACELMAAALGWSPERAERELAAYIRWVAAQLVGEAEPDDGAAYQALAEGRSART